VSVQVGWSTFSISLSLLGGRGQGEGGAVVRAEKLPAVRVEGRSHETRAELIPQAWQFELKGGALRRELSGSAAWQFQLKSEALRRELS
jgi:hypothetical protein